VGIEHGKILFVLWKNLMNQEDAYRAYDCVRNEFPDYANFEGCPWMPTFEGWLRVNGSYWMEVTPTKVVVNGPAFKGEWAVFQWTGHDMCRDIENSLSEAPIG
jgi:hypothetical protein